MGEENTIIQFNYNIQDGNFNGERLRAARLWRNLSSIQLSEQTGVNRQTISMYENSKLKKPDFNNIQKFSKFLNFPIKFFMEDIKVDINYSATYFRSLLTTKQMYQDDQKYKVKFIKTIYNMLNEYLNFKKLNLPDIKDGTSPQEAASILRDYWGLGNKPINNIIYIAEDNGLVVSEFETNTNDVDAFSHKIEIGELETYLIGYSKNKKSAARIHFDIAHELGHILLHSSNEDLEALKDSNKEEFNKMEREAHSFASAFLLPKEEFTRDVRPYATNILYYVELKKRWKVSIAAMIRRASDLNIITPDEYARLMRTMQRKGIRKVEPLDNELVTAPPLLFQQAINMLFNHKVFTPKEFLEELSTEYGLTLFPEDIESLLGLKKGTFIEDDVLQPVISLKNKKGK